MNGLPFFIAPHPLEMVHPASRQSHGFEFATAARILVGAGTLRQAMPQMAGLGRNALVVTGRTSTRAEPLMAGLSGLGVGITPFSVPGEPTTHIVQAGAELARRESIAVVIALGGGSVVDAGKAIAGIATNPGDLLDYLEVIGGARPLEKTPLPFIAIPTTAGTGAEVTRNAVLASPEHRVKVSLRSPLLLPRLAVVDPELTLGLPASLTATTGLDALTQLIEPLVSCRANPLVDAFCRDGIPRVARSLRRACTTPDDLAAREDMSLASLLSGLALANAGLGAVHGFAAPIGGMFPAPHGAVCAALLPHAMRINVRALRERQPDSPALHRYREIAGLLTGRADSGAEEGIEWVRQLCHDLNIPTLGHHGIQASDVPDLVGKAAVASSMKANPLVLTPGELREMLEAAL